jgi:NADPH:quinone reductase-like Zn-dependent oxidoreductase
MKAVIFDKCGDPGEVLQVKEVPVPEPARGQVRVRMLASPINPSDLMYVRGQYGRQPRLPATPGFEGVGVVEAVGGGLLGRLRLGKRVAVLNGEGGNWQEQVVVPAKRVVPVPANLPDDQAATFFVNPASALVMTRYILRVPRGAWLLQTAAGSALGRMVIRLGRLYDFRTINVVRRREQAGELRRAGGDATICTADESIEERVQEITGGAGVAYALDAVGGALGSAAAGCLASGGKLLVYGTLAGEPLTVDPRFLIVGQKSVQGFWLGEWARDQSVLTMLRLFRQIRRLFKADVLSSEIGATFSLAEVKAAVTAAAQPGRHGKVLLRLSSP